jgi:hypothetical protein
MSRSSGGTPGITMLSPSSFKRTSNFLRTLSAGVP